MKTRHSFPTKYHFLFLAVYTFSVGCSFNPLGNKQVYLERGNAYMAKGRYREASIEFQKALKRDPRCVEAFAGLAQADISLHQLNDAYGALQEAVELAPERADLHLEFGKLCLAGHLYSTAEQEASSILDRDEHNASAYEFLGACEMGRKRYQEAAEAFQKLIDLKPTDGSARVNLALAFIALKQYPDAEQSLRRALDQSPHFISASLNLANLYRLCRQPDQARQLLQQATDANPEATALFISLADLLYSQRNVEDAESVLRKVDERTQKSAEDFLALGNFYLKWKQGMRAIREYQQALQAAPHNLAVENHLVDAYLSGGRIGEASALNQDALRQSPDDVDAHLEHGRILLAESKADDALIELRQQATVAPDSWQAHYILGLAYRRKGNLDEAEGELEQALGFFPNSPEILHGLAELNLAIGDLSIAEEYGKQALALFAEGVDRHLLLGNIFLRERKFNEAREQIIAARDFAPNDSAVHAALAQADAGVGNLQEAEAEFEVALRLEPQNDEVLGRLADFWVAQQHPEKALARVHQYLSAYPNDASAHIVMGSLLQGQHADLAQAEFERAIQLDPNSVQGYSRIGRLLQRQGRTDEALHHYEEALKLQPKFPPMYILIGNLYLGQGKLDIAERYYQRALAIDPNFAVAAGNLAWTYLKRNTNLNVALSLAEKAKQLMPDLDPISVLIPMKVIGDSYLIPVTGSEMKLIVFGAKRRWLSYPA